MRLHVIQGSRLWEDAIHPGRRSQRGRGAPAAVCEFADMVSEIQAVKHHYKAGVKAQQGIEF